MEELAALDTGVLIVIGVLWLVQVSLLLWALIDLVRRPSEQIRGGMKWVWVLIVLFLNLIGPIIYLLVGRLPAPVTDAEAPELDTDKTQRAVDTLYGERENQ
jgi:hypothetical protein